MNVREIIDTIHKTAEAQLGVKSVYDGDVYENWNSSETEFASVNTGLQNVTYNGNMVIYTFVFYYGDRLLQDKSNVNDIYTDAVRVLQSTVNGLNNLDGIDIEGQIVYTPFEQKFTDYLAGMYATVNITCESEIALCEISDFDTNI